jgi:hypothetical protein
LYKRAVALDPVYDEARYQQIAARRAAGGRNLVTSGGRADAEDYLHSERARIGHHASARIRVQTIS